MEKDIHVLVETTNPEIFEEQAKHWPGIEVFRTHAWKCKCGGPNCFMRCTQHFAALFKNLDLFTQYLLDIEGIDSWDALRKHTDKHIEKFSKPLLSNDAI